MVDFEREQREILRLSDEVRYDRSINRWEKHLRYVEIVKAFLNEHLSNNLKLVEHSHIEGFPKRFHLIMVKKDARTMVYKGKQYYDTKSVDAIIEIRGYGLIADKDRLKGMMKSKHDLYKEIKRRYAHIKCLYLTLQEREISKGTDYVKLSKKFLGQNFFYLRESTTQRIISREWKRFIKALLARA